MQIDPFFQVPVHPFTTSRGSVDLPVMFKEADGVMSLFRCELARVVNQLEGTGMTPALVFGKSALVALNYYDFMHSSLGPFRTVVLTIPVFRQQGFRPVSPWLELFSSADRRHMGFYVLGGVTNTANSYAATREIWGYPKHLANVDCALNDSKLHCTVSNGPQMIMRLAGFGMRLAKAPHLDFNLFSIKQNQLLRTLVTTRGKFNLQLPLGFRLHVGHAVHPLAQQLNALNMNGKRPVVLITCSDYQSRMHEGVVVENLLQSNLKPSPKPANFLV